MIAEFDKIYNIIGAFFLYIFLVWNILEVNHDLTFSKSASHAVLHIR